METDSINLTPVERAALANSPFEPLYPPRERIAVVTVSNFPALGKLAAMRFLEWAQSHPDGVISLPTGKTPEHFIYWVRHLLQTWDEAATQELLAAAGIDPGAKPKLAGLRFVQIDEFYPIDPAQRNSFFHYVNKFYIDGFGLDRARALLMNCREIGLDEGGDLQRVWPNWRVDLDLRTRRPTGKLEQLQQDTLLRIDDWCRRYEDAIRALGGIGFFLGGIGPDGHVGFNIRGSDHHSTTRLMATNYETQAAAAGDLGGIEISRHRLVITIGLGTITFNPQCVAIILAAGEAKAGVVQAAVEGPRGVLIPASALRQLPGARFYVTLGAARGLVERQLRLIGQNDRDDEVYLERAIVDLAVGRKKRLLDLTDADAESDVSVSTLLRRFGRPLADVAGEVRDRIVARLEAGSHRMENTRFLHTEPHHDDLMLGYLPAIVRNVRTATNVHHFVTLTSGFTAVTNDYMLRQLANLSAWLDTPSFTGLFAQGYFDPANEHARNREVWRYLDGIAARDVAMCDHGAARRLLRSLIAVYKLDGMDEIKRRLAATQDYLRGSYPGQKDPDDVQTLKGMCREWEAECLWGYFGWQSSHIHHLRLGFYTGDIFTPAPTIDRDVAPILGLLDETLPDVISVALDPEASGPDTHYKVLQAINEAALRYSEHSGRRDLRVWGYRNVWFRFHPSQANIYVPVSLNMFSVMESAFLNTFVSQREASFPSYEHDGPFCELAQRIQVEQYSAIKTCLGREWFAEHPSPLIRATRGLVFLREMNLDEFRQTARLLRQSAEAG